MKHLSREFAKLVHYDKGGHDNARAAATTSSPEEPAPKETAIVLQTQTPPLTPTTGTMVPIGAEQQAPQTEEPQEFNAEAADVQSQISRLIKEREGLSAELGELRDQLMDLKRQRVLELENIQPQRSEFLRRIDAFQSQQEELHRQIWDKLGSFEQPVEGESNGRIGDRARAKGKGTDVEEPVPAYAGPRMPLTPRTVPMEQGFRSEKPSRVTGP